MKVFLSSVITGMEDFREAANAAIRSLGHEIIRAEDFGASPRSPQEACLAAVRSADVVVLVLGARYGFMQGAGLAATHEEYREAKERCDILVFIQQDVEHEREQAAFVTEAQNWSAGQYTEPFRSAEDLRDLVTRRLRELELARQAGQPDEVEMLARSETLIPNARDTYHDVIAVALAGGPRQQILRPAEIENEALQKKIVQQALFGPDAIMTSEEATKTEVVGHTLRILQERASLVVDEQGSICIVQSATRKNERGMLPTLIQEDVLAKLQIALRFGGWILDELDRPRRLSDIVPTAALLNSSYMPWKTQREYEREPNSAVMSRATERIVVNLSPPSRKRAALINNSKELAEDLMVLLRRELAPR